MIIFAPPQPYNPRPWNQGPHSDIYFYNKAVKNLKENNCKQKYILEKYHISFIMSTDEKYRVTYQSVSEDYDGTMETIEIIEKGLKNYREKQWIIQI